MPKNFTFNGDDGDDDIAITHSSFTRQNLWKIEWHGNRVN